MDTEDFRKRGKEMVDYIADYIDNIHTRNVSPEVSPGYLSQQVPDHAPQVGQSYDIIMKDVEEKIMPGLLHHQHPHFNAYFPAGHSFPSILGNMLADGMACVSTSWATSPACTELEMVVTDWLGKMIGLPKECLHESGKGGGVIQGSGSECILIALLAARYRAIQKLKKEYPDEDEGKLLSKLVAYSSSLANISVDKACRLGFVKLRTLDIDDKFSLRGETLQQAITRDKKAGLYPFFVCATIGTTSVCSFDDIKELSQIGKNENVWLHVDGAYAGAALVCPEFQYLIEGIQDVTSFSCNPHKWLLTGTEAAVMWVRDKMLIKSAMEVDSVYLKHKNQDNAVDFRHWTIDMSRPFRAMKLWFVLRMYGVSGIQEFIRRHVALAKRMEKHIQKEPGIEVIGQATLGMVCFRLEGPNEQSQMLLKKINESGKLHLTPAKIKDTFVIRYVVCAERTTEADVDFAWNAILRAVNDVLAKRG